MHRLVCVPTRELRCIAQQRHQHWHRAFSSVYIRHKDYRPHLSTSKADSSAYPYRHLLPVSSSLHYPPLEPFDHVDPGSRALAQPNPRAFLDNGTVVRLTPEFGSQVQGVNLADLDDNGRDQLALEVARRGLLVFRDQKDFIDRGPDFYKQWGSYFGRLHIHPTSSHPAGYPEFHLVYREAGTSYNYESEDSITTVGWHSDSSCELQPPGLTTFFLLAQPTTGGDTLFNSQVLALKRLSPTFVAFLRTLKAVHSGFTEAAYSRDGKRGINIVRREPVENVHPIVRKHPVTGDEALFVNIKFTRHIVGFKKEESETLLKFLFDHIEKGADNQARVKWEPHTIVLWDNRIVAHTVMVDYKTSGERRHGLRITPQAERPIGHDST